MDAQPSIVLNDALATAKPFLTKAGDVMSATLVEQLDTEPHYAEIEIRVTARIVNPGTGVIAEIDVPERYQVHWRRNPDSAEQGE